MNRFLALFKFYKIFIAWSLVANLIIGIINPNYFAAIFTKLFLTAFAWYFMSETSNKRQLTFYKNLGISSLFLFSFVFVFDSIVTITFIFLVRALT